MARDLEHKRHTLVGQDKQGNFWKVDLLLDRGLQIEQISLNGRPLDLELQTLEPLFLSCQKNPLPRIACEPWQPGMGDGKIFAYYLPENKALSLRVDLWISAQGLHLKLFYQSEKPSIVGWKVLNPPSLCHDEPVADKEPAEKRLLHPNAQKPIQAYSLQTSYKASWQEHAANQKGIYHLQVLAEEGSLELSKSPSVGDGPPAFNIQMHSKSASCQSTLELLFSWSR